MRLLVLGATGPSGLYLVKQALQEGHDVTVYARSPHKIPNELLAKIKVVQGVFDASDKAKLREALHGADAVLSALGPSPFPSNPFVGSVPTGALTRAFVLIIECMKAENVSRLIALGTISQAFPRDTTSLLASILVWGISTIARSSYLDIVGMGKVIPEHCDEAKIQWTIVRVSLLNSFGAEEGKAVNAGWIGETGVILRRMDFARFVLDELRQGQWINKAPVISSKYWL